MKDLNKLVPAPITLVLASNSGRPGGSCSRRNGRNFVPDIEALTSGKHYKTNEESVLSTLALESPPAILNAMEGLYLQYGMCDASGSDTLTRQGIDYTIAEPPEYQKAWSSIWIDSNKSSVLLVAACPPNVGVHPKDPMSTMRRTYSEKLAQHFDLFRLALEYTVYASLQEAKYHDYPMVIMPAVGCGIYAGDHKVRIISIFMKLLKEVCEGRFSDGTKKPPIPGLSIVFVTLE